MAGQTRVDMSASISDSSHDNNGEPPKKRQKLSIRPPSRTHHSNQPHHHQHRTLESFGFGIPPKPPAKITRVEPHGQLHQTINGVKSSLDVDEDELLGASPAPVKKALTRLAPSPAPANVAKVHHKEEGKKKEDRRTLRSQDEGHARLKSELAVYFPNYEDIMFDAPREEEFLTLDTLLYVADDTAKKKDDKSSPAKSSKRRTSVNGAAGPPATPQRSSSNGFNGSPTVNLDFLATTIGDNPLDPLTDEHFLKSHAKAERKEKQLRNIERERAMHEKHQLDRLLDGLQGHDWLRVLGITGITDGEAKKYEPKRDYFIAEVKALVDKFASWKDQEKKLRLRKEAAQAARDAEEDADTTEESVEPSSSDLNASAARQLQQETVNTLKSATKHKGKASHTSHPSTPLSTSRIALPALPPSPEVPITSFYAKRHLRDAALSKTRNTGRNVTAFGQPVPEMEDQDFSLPEDYVTEDALRANARERRRRKRETAANAKEGKS